MGYVKGGDCEPNGQECCMSNKAQRVGSRGPYSTRRSQVLYGALRPHTECSLTNTAHTVHAITTLLCFSSVNHKTVLGSSAVRLIQDS